MTTSSYFAMPGIHKRPPHHELIIKRVCEQYKITEEQIKRRCQDRWIIDPRHTAMYIIKKKHPTITLKTIGLMFGNYDHATVLCAIRSMTNSIEVYDERGKKCLNILHSF